MGEGAMAKNTGGYALEEALRIDAAKTIEDEGVRDVEGACDEAGKRDGLEKLGARLRRGLHAETIVACRD